VCATTTPCRSSGTLASTAVRSSGRAASARYAACCCLPARSTSAAPLRMVRSASVMAAARPAASSGTTGGARRQRGRPGSARRPVRATAPPVAPARSASARRQPAVTVRPRRRRPAGSSRPSGRRRGRAAGRSAHPHGRRPRLSDPGGRVLLRRGRRGGGRHGRRGQRAGAAPPCPAGPAVLAAARVPPDPARRSGARRRSARGVRRAAAGHPLRLLAVGPRGRQRSRRRVGPTRG
jgi:hypothetical protein